MSELEMTKVAILGDEVDATLDQYRIESLQFLPDNPRVYASVREIPNFDKLSDDDKQATIFEQLKKETSFKNLKPEIERDGGLQEPVLVRADTRQVIEGNSRLAIYRQLNEENPEDERWQKIRCLVITRLTPDQQIRILGQAHLHGKTDWTPYAKALFCYRWVRDDQREAKELSKISGLSVRFINKQVAIVELMIKNEDDKESHYSYYDVALTNKRISSLLDSLENEQLRDIVLSGIKDEDFTAQQLRDWMPVVLEKPKITKKFASGNISLKEAYERAEVSETKNQFERVLGLLEAIEARDVSSLQFAEIRVVQQVARKVCKKSKRLLDMVNDRVQETSRLRRSKETYTHGQSISPQIVN